MVKKVSCNIIRDILPLYADDVVSDDTRAMVEEHLAGCRECCNELIAMQQDVILPGNPSIQMEEARTLKQLKRRLSMKRLKAVIISVLAAVALLAGIYYWTNVKKIYIPYEDLQIQVHNNNGILYARCKGVYRGNVNSKTVIRRTSVENQDIVIICIYDTIWSLYIEPLFPWSEGEKDNDFLFLGDVWDIDQVYYGQWDEKDIYYEDSAYLDEFRKIWERQ